MAVYLTGAAAIAAGAALADSAPPPDDFARYANPQSIVLAVRADFAAAGGAVRLAAYDEVEFLKVAAFKVEAPIGEDGMAIADLPGMKAGAYAFVAYYDENGDGRLNRGAVLGKPKEPYAFSNGVKPKLRKPRFEEARVDVAPGAVVVLTLED